MPADAAANTTHRIREALERLSIGLAVIPDEHFLSHNVTYEVVENINCGRNCIVQKLLIVESDPPQYVACRFLWSDDVDRFKSELRTLQLIKDIPGTLTIIDAFRYENYYGIVSEYFSATLRSLLNHVERLPSSLVSIYIKQLLTIIEQLHGSIDGVSIVHGDICPENITLDEKGHCVLIDFGSSSICANEIDTITVTEDMSELSVHTNRQFRGNLRYTPPECADDVARNCLRRKDNDGPSHHEWFRASIETDIWCLGITTLELVLGWTPFDLCTVFAGEDGCPVWCDRDLLKVVTAAHFIDLLLKNAENMVPEETLDFIRLCLTIDPDLRPNCAELNKHPFITSKPSSCPTVEEAVIIARRHSQHSLVNYIPPAVAVMQQTIWQYTRHDRAYLRELTKLTKQRDDASLFPFSTVLDILKLPLQLKGLFNLNNNETGSQEKDIEDHSILTDIEPGYMIGSVQSNFFSPQDHSHISSVCAHVSTVNGPLNARLSPKDGSNSIQYCSATEEVIDCSSTEDDSPDTARRIKWKTKLTRWMSSMVPSYFVREYDARSLSTSSGRYLSGLSTPLNPSSIQLESEIIPEEPSAEDRWLVPNRRPWPF